MLQPFEIFKPKLISKLKELGRPYLVSQSYPRAEANCTDPGRINLLLTDYPDLGQAKLHLNAVKTDKYAAIVDLSNPLHEAKMQDMLAGSSPYKLYFAAVQSSKALENDVNRLYKDLVRRYLEKETNWKLSRDTSLRPTLQLTFGELFILIKHGTQSIRIKFSDIEQA